MTAARATKRQWWPDHPAKRAMVVVVALWAVAFTLVFIERVPSIYAMAHPIEDGFHTSHGNYTSSEWMVHCLQWSVFAACFWTVPPLLFGLMLATVAWFVVGDRQAADQTVGGGG